jgi:hypothetical protein
MHDEQDIDVIDDAIPIVAKMISCGFVKTAIVSRRDWRIHKCETNVLGWVLCSVSKPRM